MDDSLLALLDRYDEDLKLLEQWPAQDVPDTPRSFADVLLDILYRRDDIHQALGAKRQTSDRLEQLVNLDDRLKAQANPISDRFKFADYRRSLPEGTENWWWHLEEYRQPHRFDRLDWLFQSLTLLCWPFNFALLLDIGQRFLGGGVGVGSVLAVLAPTLLTLLQANSELTQTGKEAFDRLIERLGIPTHWREEAKFGSTFTLLVGLTVLWSCLPNISNYYNQKAVEAYESEDIGTAEQNFKQAIALDSDNAEAHYNLGDLYEKLQKIKEAREHYEQAAQSQLPEAYNNLARLDIQDKNYDTAVARLQEGLRLADQPNNPEPALPELRYSILKNLGWARLEQNRLDEAQAYLESAIELQNQSSESDRSYVRNPGSAACLLAQVLDQQKQSDLALKYWQDCSEQASSLDSNEDRWLHQAKQKLSDSKPADPDITDLNIPRPTSPRRSP